MLTTLRRIVQEINGASNLPDALTMMVQCVREAMNTEACTIYLIDQQRSEFVLMATEGLNPNAVGNVRISTKQGLIGLVAQRGEPINLGDATTHPQFLSLPNIGEERFKAFLAVPIVHQRKLVGVLVVQEENERRFDESEEAFLVTLSAQLGGLITQAEAAALIAKLDPSTNNEEDTTFTGVPAAPGVGIGVAVVIYPPADLDAVPDKEAESIQDEIVRFEKALADTRADIAVLKERLSTSLPPDEQSLFDAFLKILESDHLGQEIITVIKAGQWAQGALRQVIKRHIAQFEAMEDEYLSERATDIADLGRRILAHLQEEGRTAPDYPEQTILVGNEISASALAEVPEDRLMGVVSRRGSNNSHAAILARALGVPAIMGVESVPLSGVDGREVIIDGYYGHMYLAPSQALRQEFTVLLKEEKELQADLAQLRTLPAETLDGSRMRLYVNTGLLTDVGRSLSVGAEGVGLYRTEVPFMVRDRFPTEEEQRVIYRQLLGVFAPRPVTMRTLDIGGDKELPYFPVREENPFLGWRGIRISLDHPEIFLVQVRAMLRASLGLNNLRIMLPMICGVTEYKQAMRLLKQAYAEVAEEHPEVEMPPVGVMIEVPSAVYQAQALAERVDFLSIGSNDLTQYLLAVDRNNSRVASLYESLHPAVLQALKHVVDCAHRQAKPVSICGEMAGDPVSVIVLLAMGFDHLSMSAVSLPRVKWVIRNFNMSHARELLEELLGLYDPMAVRSRLELALDRAGLGGLLRAGK